MGSGKGQSRRVQSGVPQPLVSAPVIGLNSNREWRIGGKVDGDLHRVGGPAVICPNGIKEWWVEGELHREDGPARERPDGGKEWWWHSKPHRLDGPAVMWADGTREWWVNGEEVSEEEVRAAELAEKERQIPAAVRKRVTF